MALKIVVNHVKALHCLPSVRCRRSRLTLGQTSDGDMHIFGVTSPWRIGFIGVA